MILIGGAVNQGTAYSQQLVQGGAKLLDDFLTDSIKSTIVSKTFGETAGNLYDVAVNANEVIHAGESAPPYSGGPSDTLTSKLTVSTAGAGSGTIESYPGGLVCGAADSTDCVIPFDTGETIYLEDELTNGSTFTGYNGACTGASCELTLNGNETVDATFAPGSSGTTDAVTPLALNLGSVGGCSGGTISGAVYITAPPGVTWTWPPAGSAGDPTLSASPMTGTGSGVVTVTDTQAPQPPPTGSSCSNTQPISELSYIQIGFSDGQSVQITVAYTYIYVAF
jgi:hypothetical protein